MNTKLINAVKQFPQSDKWVLVIGDLMLDRYLVGDVQRISPEAPVPVVLLKQQNDRAGGAANVAANLAELGVETHIAGCVGQDTEASILLGLINRLGISTDAVIHSETRPTTAKTRVMSSHQQIVRIDQESAEAFNQAESTELRVRIDEALKNKPAIVILSDYAKGVLSDTSGAISNTFEFTEKQVHDIVVPLAKVIALPVEATPADVELAVKDHGFSRYPLLSADGGLAGYVHIKDVLDLDDDEYNSPLPTKRLRTLIGFADTTELEDALASMRRGGHHLGKAYNSLGEVTGIIFLEDILEELVGEVQDATTK